MQHGLFFVDVKDEGLAGLGRAGHCVARQVLGGTFIDLKFVLDAFFFLSVLVDCRISGEKKIGGGGGGGGKQRICIIYEELIIFMLTSVW